jgi:hypothetical protein
VSQAQQREPHSIRRPAGPTLNLQVSASWV